MPCGSRWSMLSVFGLLHKRGIPAIGSRCAPAALDPLALHERRDEGDERRSALADHAPPQPAVGNEQYDAARSHEGAAVDHERSTDALIPGVLCNEPSGGTRREEQVVKPLVERPEAYPSRRFRPAEQKVCTFGRWNRKLSSTNATTWKSTATIAKS